MALSGGLGVVYQSGPGKAIMPGAIKEQYRFSAMPACLCPWQENPYRLATLWDLVMRHAPVSEIVKILRDLWISSSLASNLYLPNDIRYRHAQVQSTFGYLDTLDALCVDLDLPMSRLHVQDTLSAMRSLLDGSIKSPEFAEKAVMVLSNNIEKELSLKLFLTLPHDKAKVFDDAGFGDGCANAFPSAQYDIQEAARCYAVARNTACVFHLMRVLEIGLSVLANQFNVSSAHTNWETIIKQIEKAIVAMDQDPNRLPTWKDDREFYSQCASHFRVVKDAWRNYTAHARSKYDEQEALDMLGNVRGFMQKLATRLHE